MDEQIVQQIVDEILSPLEPLDTRSAALLEFLKAKGMASDEELAPYLEQAGNASNVRWLAARVRIRSLISSAMKTVESKPAEQPAESANSIAESPEPAEETKQETSQEGKTETRPAAEKSDENPPPDKPVRANTEKDENKKESKPVKSNEVAKESAA
jgi:hypothetical protein